MTVFYLLYIKNKKEKIQYRSYSNIMYVCKSLENGVTDNLEHRKYTNNLI